MNTGALFSNDRLHRYKLWRSWDTNKPMCAFIGLNPSTADEVENDPTIRRCIRYAKDWGYGGLVMLNIFAYRATDPKVMKRAADPVGPDNDMHIVREARRCSLIVAAWGTHGAFRDRGRHAGRLLDRDDVNLCALGTTQAGHPKHPLYLPADLRPAPYSVRSIVLQ